MTLQRIKGLLEIIYFLWINEVSLCLIAYAYSICQICDESLLAVKCVSVVEAVESALKAIKEGRPQDNLQGYLALNDLILDQIMNVSLNIREQMFSQKEANSLWSDWKKV